MTDINTLTNEELIAHVKQKIKMEKLKKESAEYLNRLETGVKPIPIEKFLKMKLINKPKI